MASAVAAAVVAGNGDDVRIHDFMASDAGALLSTLRKHLEEDEELSGKALESLIARVYAPLCGQDVHRALSCFARGGGMGGGGAVGERRTRR